MLPKRLIGRVSALLGGEIVLQPQRRETQTLSPRAWDRPGGLPPLPILLAACLAQPSHPALCPGEDPLNVKPVHRLARGLLLCAALLGRLVTFARELAREPLTPASLGLKLQRQLVTARVAVLLVLSLVGRDRLGDDLPRDPVIVHVGITGRARR